MSLLTKETYATFKTWQEKYPDGKVLLKSIKYDKSWKDLFQQLFDDSKYKKIKESLAEELRIKTDVLIHPAPKLIFNAFSMTPFDKVSVVILGQDPYFDHEIHDKKVVHQAMGLSFSVPVGVKIPSSLQNIYANLFKNKHISSLPTHGNLESWASQGCLLLNTSLTVLDGSSNKNCHQNVWKWFTDKIIKYISDNKDNVIFVLWGASAFEKESLIDLDKHEIIVSSHPSGLSANSPFRNYPSFNSFDHFGKINTILKKWKKKEIDWNIF
jgi:uracil-DNA glycosylase